MKIRLLLLSLLLGISFAATRLFIPVEFDEIDQPMINVTVRYVHFSVGRWFASDETRLVHVNNDIVLCIGNSFRNNQISRVLIFSVEEQSSRIGMVLENDDRVIRFQDHDEVMQMNYIGVGRLSQIFQRFESITLLRYSDEAQFGSIIFGGSLDFFRDHHCGASSLISIPLTSFDTFTGHIGTDDARDRLPPRITFQINSLDNKDILFNVPTRFITFLEIRILDLGAQIVSFDHLGESNERPLFGNCSQAVMRQHI